MRTTIDIDDDVLAEVKAMAAARKVSTGKVLSEVARTGLSVGSAETRELEEDEEVSHGVHFLPRRSGVVTTELVNRLRDEED